MIPFNLREDKYKNHPKDGMYGVISNGTMYNGYPITIVDDSETVENGRYTGKPALVLLHLAEGVRSYLSAKLFEEFHYLSFGIPKFVPTYRMFDYTKRALSESEVIDTLKRIMYDVSPELHSRTCLGWGSRLLKDDPNRYIGKYVLNDEQEYVIEKTKDKIVFFKIEEDQREKMYEEELNFDVYEKAREVYTLRRRIVMNTNEMLDAGMGETIQAYEQARKELDEKLKTI